MRGDTLISRLGHFTDNVSYLFVYLFFQKRITYNERRNVSLIIANLLPCEESNTVVVDPAKLYGCETTGNIYWNSEMGCCRSCEYAVLRDNCVVDPAKLQGRETGKKKKSY